MDLVMGFRFSAPKMRFSRHNDDNGVFMRGIENGEAKSKGNRRVEAIFKDRG